MIFTGIRYRSSARGLMFIYIRGRGRGGALPGGLRRAGSGDAIEDFDWIFAESDPFVEGVIQKTFFFQLAQVCHQVVVESSGVENIDLFAVDLQLVPGEHFEELVEGTEATRED